MLDVDVRARSAVVADRIMGVDAARGLALLGMMAVHVIDTFGPDGRPTAATTIAGGRSAATFALIAGVSLAFMSGGVHVVEGRVRTAARWGIAVRAVLIGSIGLAIGYLAAADVDVILVYYAVLFLLALPLLGLRPRVLAGIAAVAVAVAPLLRVAGVLADLPTVHGGNPTFTSLVADPGGMLAGLFVTGPYPVLGYLAYICAGLAIGRLDLTSRGVGARLLGGGLVLAVVAWTVSTWLLLGLGGLERLRDAAPSRLGPDAAAYRILWEPHETSSWWQLALRAPHSGTTFDLVHTLGSAMAVLGAALLLCAVPAVARLLQPLAAVGSMPLTLYCGHLLVLATGVLDDEPVVLYFLLVVAVLVLAAVWRHHFRQGPLEWLVSEAARRARRAVLLRVG